MEFTFLSVTTCVVAILVASITTVIFLGGKSQSARAYSIAIGLVGIWILIIGILPAIKSSGTALSLVRIAYFVGTLIATTFFYFFSIFPNWKKCKSRIVIILFCLEAIFAYIFIFTDKIISDVFVIGDINKWGWHFGNLSYMAEISFLTFFLFGIIISTRKLKRSNDALEKRNIRLMITTVVVGFTPPIILSVILPRLSFFQLNMFGAISEILWVPIISYSIIRYRQMNVRAVVTEVLAIAMAAIFFVNIFIDTQFGVYGRIAAFMVFLVLAYYLIRGTLREAAQRQELRDLNENLEARVAEQTVEIRRSYEAEKHARVELEKLNDAKDQFIMITQHHLRTPVNGIIWALESVKRSTVLEAALENGHRLMKIVDDFLNITAIKIGTNILNLETKSLKPAIDDILTELKPAITDMNVSIELPTTDSAWPLLEIDAGKMRESLFIVFENAVRYNTKGGSVKIATSHTSEKFTLIVENTGLGISHEESQKIGSALFYRGQFARKAYPIGMGVGLSVVKAIIRAHKGTFEIRSDGPNKGARVTITLPFKQPF